MENSQEPTGPVARIIKVRVPTSATTGSPDVRREEIKQVRADSPKTAAALANIFPATVPAPTDDPAPIRIARAQPVSAVLSESVTTAPAEPSKVAQLPAAPVTPAPAPQMTTPEAPLDEPAPVRTSQPQMWLPCAPQGRCGVTCPINGCECEPRWRDQRPVPWQVFAQGEYVGPARLAHVPQYHIRVDDILRVVYGLTGAPSTRPYELAVGDIIKIESLGSPNLERQVSVQPDGMVTMRMLGQVPAAGRSIEELRKDLENQYSRYVKEPAISITPVKLNTRVEELRAAVDQRYGTGGQGVFVRVTPAGYIQLPSIGSVPAQGLTLDEIKDEIEARYARRFHGIEVTPVLDRRAPRYIYVLGEVKTPGRYELEGPTTAMQAIAMAGSWNVGAELRQIVVFRRDECWRLMATRLQLRCALDGKRPCPHDEIWLRDSDIVLVPKSALLKTDDFINLAFTRGIYAAFPINFGVSWTNLTAL